MKNADGNDSSDVVHANQPVVTVILLSFNSSSRIIPTLESIIAQDYPCIEVIFADDGSTDDTNDLIDHAIGEFDGRVMSMRHIRNAINLGTVRNLLNATRQSIGDFVKPIGAGDLLYDIDTLSCYVSAAVNNTRKLIAGYIRPYSMVNGMPVASKELHPRPEMKGLFDTPSKALATYLRYDYFFSGSSMFYPKNLIFENPLPPGVIYVEDLIQILVSARGYGVEPIEKCAIWYEKDIGVSSEETFRSHVLPDWLSFYSFSGSNFDEPSIRKRFARKAAFLDALANGKRMSLRSRISSGISRLAFRFRYALALKLHDDVSPLLARSGEGLFPLIRHNIKTQ